jgi:hypothetical protein
MVRLVCCTLLPVWPFDSEVTVPDAHASLVCVSSNQQAYERVTDYNVLL